MQKSILFLLLLGMISTAAKSQTSNKNDSPRTLEVAFNRNIEFMGFTFFLGSAYMGQQYENNEELTHNGVKKKDWYAYDLALYQQYKSFLGNKNLETAVAFIEKLQGGDLIMLLLQLDDFPNARLKDTIEERYLLPFSDTKDPADARKQVSLFIDALNQFYREVNFDTYFTAHSKHYESALQQVKNNIPSGEMIPAMEKFYRHRFDKYTLLPSLTVPAGMGFGVKLETAAHTRIYNTFGPYALQQFSDESRLDMGFGDKKHLRELSTHEFGHSFSNPAVDKIPQGLVDQTASLFEPVKMAMEEQGYLDWKSCLYEHFVRASEVVITRQMGYTNDAADLQKHYINDRKFIYLPVIIEQLMSYSGNKNISYVDAVKRSIEKLKAMHTKS